MASDVGMTSEGLVAQLKQIAERLGKPSVTRSEFIRESGVSEWQIYRHFDNWTDLVKAAGLEANDKSRLDDDQLFDAMKDAFLAAGGIVTQSKFDRLCRYNVSVYKRRGWGNWIGVLSRFREWAAIHAADFPYMAALPQAPSPTEPPEVIQDADGAATPKSPAASWSAKGGRRYGSFLNFRGLLHAPLNEQGVVFLFGMVALELGYVVESITPGFPDCEAKRRVSKSGDTWERTRIEFEFESRNFLTHGHRLEDCDVIVCWEDNWPDCPIEVMELKSVIQNLDG
jgi:hypothetical protein